MKNLLEKIRNRCNWLIVKVLFTCLSVCLLLWFSQSEIAREASIPYEAGAHRAVLIAASEREEVEDETEVWTEASTEAQSEAFTPAELAALEEETEDDSAVEEDSPNSWMKALRPDANVLLAGIVCLPPVLADFRIPMAMPEPMQKDGLSFCQWKLVSEKYKITSAEQVPPFELLRKMVEKRVDGYDGDWSVYVKNLKTDESFVVNDRPMKSASVMKLFIMGTVYKAIEAGKLDRTDEVVSLLNSMITASDNEASNRLLYLLGNSSYADGIAQVDEFIREYGFSDMTVEYNGFNNSDTVISPDHNNQVAAKDCGKLLEDIYRRTWLNRAEASEAEQMMLNQDTRYKIPAGLPEGVSCGNKTGEMETTENDAAIIYAKDCDYILVVLSSDWNSKDQAISRIASMSEMVYEFLN